MINDNMIKTIKNIHTYMTYDMTDYLAMSVSTVNAQEIAEALLSDNVLPANTSLLSYPEALRYFIDFCSYVENETDKPALISDELYDKLVETLVDMGGSQPIGSPTASSEGKLPHKYPELRGSLSKVHFVWEKDIPKGDNRKSLEWYFTNVANQLKEASVPLDGFHLNVNFKYDGVSHIMECKGSKGINVLTRGDVEKNLGKDLTPLYKEFAPTEDKEAIDISHIINHNDWFFCVPKVLMEGNYEYGIKYETFMRSNDFERFKESYKMDNCNRRSAVTSICNMEPQNITDPQFAFNCLCMQDFQISTIEDIEFDLTDELDIWVPIGKINGRYQYIYTGGGYNTKDLSFADIDSCCRTVELLIDLLKKDAEKFNIPIDGIVISILNPRMVETLGRNNDKNMFQVAYKFSAGEEKTTINDVEFQVGPVYGHITPVAKVSPVVINGNTITSVSLSNKDKFDSLNLHLGDEVIIRYDIIPTLYKDSTCKESDYPLIEFPTNCPTCGAELIEGRCPNSECAAKVIGHIYKFVETLKIPNIGFKTIEDLYIAGILETIGDLYRLYRHKDIICNIPGYGESSTTLILDGISSVRKIPAYRLFGAIGIPNIGVKTMEKVCREINVFEHLDDLESMRSKLIAIDGIGAKKADLIISGIENKIDVIKDICANVDIIEEYEVLVNPTGEVVCFTNVRDSKFEDFLRSKGVDTSDSFTSKVTTLIVPDEPMDKETTKVTKAKDKGIEIITISEAYSRWGYQN